MAKAKGARINMRSINKKVGRSGRLKGRIDLAAKKKFAIAKSRLLSEFDNHPVTRELQAGSGGSNLSDTLGGYGNLFSYIGFPSGMDPTVAVRNFLVSSISIRRGRLISRGNKINVNYNISVPSLQDFNFAAMPWESGKNWVQGVESGVSGFNYYLSKAAKASRSGEGIQIDGNLRSQTASAGIKYISKMVMDLKKRINKI